MKIVSRLILAAIVAGLMPAGISIAQNNQPLETNKTPDIIKNTLNLIPTVEIGTTEQQIEAIRSFLVNNANKVPNLNLTQQQINAIISYFDVDPAVLKINLTPQQIQAIQFAVQNNLNRIAGLRLSEQDLSTVITITTNNSANISYLIRNNPEIASLIRSIAPQINRIAAINQQLGAIITVLRTTVPEINTLLAI